MTQQMMCQTKPRRYRLVIRSIWYWDLWVAIGLGAGVFIVWILTTPDPRWQWIVPVITAAVGTLALVWNQWNSLRTRLRGSSYGELVRITDETEIEISLPYTITLWISLVLLFWSTITAVLIEDINNIWAEAFMLSVTSLLTIWLVLGIGTLLRLSTEHDRNMAEIESIREQLEAEQRRYETKDKSD